MASGQQMRRPSPEMSSFGIWITSLMIKHEMSLADMDRATGISDRTIRAWINGDSYPKVVNMLAIAEVLSIKEQCFFDTMLMECISHCDGYIQAKKREARRWERGLMDWADDVEGV
jgi:transcriptional regulator with XRE-family HTH domain